MVELREKLERVKRSTRNSDVLDICAALETRLGKEVGTVFDRRAYMREYMRRYRKKASLLKANPFDD